MTIEIGSVPTATPSRTTSSSAGASTLGDALAAGQLRVKQIMADFDAQRRQAAQATLALAQKQVLNTFHNVMKLRALGGDMHFMVDMVDSALRMAQPAIKTLRNSSDQSSATGANASAKLNKQVGDMANVAEEVGLVAQMTARDPDAVKRVNQSSSYLATTLRQTRGLTVFA